MTDAKTGRRIYRKRLEFNGGRVDPSLTLAGNRLFVSNTRGATVVFRPGRKYQEIARSKLNDGFSSSLAFAGKRLFMRTAKYLYCIEEKATRTAGDNPSKR